MPEPHDTNAQDTHPQGTAGRLRPGLVAASAAGAAAPFDCFAEAYDRFGELAALLYPAVQVWITRTVAAAAGPRRRAVDLGCGTGRYTTVLAEGYQQVDGYDISPTMVDTAVARRSWPNITYHVRDLTTLTPERDGDADLVLSVNTLHHAGPPGAVLPRVRGLLAPGGTLVILDITADPEQWTNPDWHIDRAFGLARRLYDATRSRQIPQTVFDTFLHDQWLAMVARDIPLSRAEFGGQYRRELPGAVITDDLHEQMTAAVWRHPGP